MAKKKILDKSELKLKPQDFEKKWQERWLKERVYQPDIKNAKKPFYNLMMFPYPSAEGLHVGNMYAFTGADIYGRFKRMNGEDVLEPIGLDGFGIHSENYALKVGNHPMDQAKKSEENFYRQLGSIGNGFAWENRVETYDPDYYKWTQWIFTQMFKRGLAYRKNSPVNFCPKDKTVLSDEQVIDGACERCGTQVEKRDMEQWFFRITAYADRLDKNLPQLDWAQKVKTAQKNWIGKKDGINIAYRVIGNELLDGRSELPITNNSKPISITCFTTRPDTNFGATFVVIAPEHPFVTGLLRGKGKVDSAKLTEIRDYVERSKKKSDQERIAEGREKTGVFTGLYCLNELNGYKMPLYISDFVLMGFGTGAVVGVPGHDMRDFEFAKKFSIAIKRVVVGKDGDSSEILKAEQVQEENGKMINSGFLDGLDIHEATAKMMDYLEEKGWGKKVTTYRLRDWCISRQRYWGPPIPMIYCENCATAGKSWFTTPEAKTTENLKLKMEDYSDEVKGWYPVKDDDLPVPLPYIEDYQPKGSGKAPLANHKEFYETKCPGCGSDAKRETDVSDTFLDSAWYFLRYPRVDEKVRAWDPEITRKWLPVEVYIGGAEHSVLHLMYARFVTMAFCDWNKLEFEEPFTKFYAHGLIISEGAKMSKSKGNVIVPDQYIALYGADTLRSYLMFLGPFDAGGDFRDTGIAGMYRFLSRVWRLVLEHQEKLTANKRTSRLDAIMNKTVREVTQDMASFRYNTAMSHIMELVNAYMDAPNDIKHDHVRVLLLLLAPFAPHMTEELWEMIGEKFSIHREKWPTFDEKLLIEKTALLIIQVNGKVRDVLEIDSEKGKVQSEVEELAKKSEKLQRHLIDQKIKKVIFVPGKLINFVV